VCHTAASLAADEEKYRARLAEIRVTMPHRRMRVAAIAAHPEVTRPSAALPTSRYPLSHQSRTRSVIPVQKRAASSENV